MSLATISARSVFRVNTSDDAKAELRTVSYAAFLLLIDGEDLVPVSERSFYRYLKAVSSYATAWHAGVMPGS